MVGMRADDLAANVIDKLLSRNDINDIDYEDTITDSRGKKINWVKEFFTNLNPDPYGDKRK